MAEALGMESDGLLLKAGYVPDRHERGEDDEYLLMLVGTLSGEQQDAVKAYIQHVKDHDVRATIKRSGVRPVASE
jgi:hypothetical protein